MIYDLQLHAKNRKSSIVNYKSSDFSELHHLRLHCLIVRLEPVDATIRLFCFVLVPELQVALRKEMEEFRAAPRAGNGFLQKRRCLFKALRGNARATEGGRAFWSFGIAV